MADCKRKTANLFDDFDIIGQVPSVSNGNLVNSALGGTTSFIKMGSAAIVLSHNVIANIYLFLYNNDFQFIGYVQENNGEPIYSTSISGYSNAVYCRVRVDNLADFNNANIMLNIGSTALPYEPYGWLHSLRKLGTATDTITTLPADLYADGNNATVGLVGNMQQTGTPTPQNPIQPSECGDLETTGTHAGQYKIPISSGQQTTPIYLGSASSTRQIKKYVVTGNETISHYDYDYQRFLLTIPTIPSIGTRLTPIICTHYIGIYDGRPIAQVPMYAVYTGSDTDNSILIKTDQTTDRSTFIAWLQEQYANGTPVTIWYAVSTPETAVVNEPLRKIGDYVDAVSGITVPTITGKDTFDVLTTLKPSEVELTYTGWHDANVKESDGSQWNE